MRVYNNHHTAGFVSKVKLQENKWYHHPMNAFKYHTLAGENHAAIRLREAQIQTKKTDRRHVILC